MRMQQKIFTGNDVAYLEKLTSVSVIHITPLKYIITAPVVGTNIYATLAGQTVEFVDYAQIDNAGSIGKFSLDTSNNLYLIVDQTKVLDMCDARNVLTGYVVTYTTKPLTYYDSVPTYTMKTYDINNYLVCETMASELPVLMAKMKCLDTNLDITNAGTYRHELVRTVTTLKNGG